MENSCQLKRAEKIIPNPVVSGVQYRVRVKCPHRNDKDMGLNPLASRNKNQTLGDPPTEGSLRV